MKSSELLIRLHFLKLPDLLKFNCSNFFHTGYQQLKFRLPLNFEKYFFDLSTAELLVAQNLRAYFKFIFVNTNTKETMELTLKQVFEKAKGIHPVSSIQF